MAYVALAAGLPLENELACDVALGIITDTAASATAIPARTSFPSARIWCATAAI